MNPRTHIADLSVAFDSGPTFTFGDLDVSGVRRYPEEIIHNVNPIQPGDIYDVARVNELQRQLQNTPYYASVAIDADNDVGQARRHADSPEGQRVSVQQRALRRRLCDRHRPAHPGFVQYLDTFGKAYPFTISGRLDQTQQYGQVTLAMPPGTRGWVNSVLASYTNTNVSDTRIYSCARGVQRSRSTQIIDTTYSLIFYDDRLDAERARTRRMRARSCRRGVDPPQRRRSAVPAQAAT